MNSKMWFLGGVLVTLSAVSITAEAWADPIGIVQVVSPAQLAGRLALEDFEDERFVAGVRFEAEGGVRRVSAEDAARSVTPSGRFGLIQEAFDLPPLDIRFLRPVSSVGMFFGNDDPLFSSGFTAFLDAFAGDTLLGSVGVQANMNDFADQFIGFNSNQTVSRVRIRFGASGPEDLFTYIDDVYFDVSAVPEPGTLLLLATGVGLGLYRRRGARPAHV